MSRGKIYDERGHRACCDGRLGASQHVRVRDRDHGHVLSALRDVAPRARPFQHSANLSPRCRSGISCPE